MTRCSLIWISIFIFLCVLGPVFSVGHMSYNITGIRLFVIFFSAMSFLMLHRSASGALSLHAFIVFWVVYSLFQVIIIQSMGGELFLWHAYVLNLLFVLLMSITSSYLFCDIDREVLYKLSRVWVVLSVIVVLFAYYEINTHTFLFINSFRPDIRTRALMYLRDNYHIALVTFSNPNGLSAYLSLSGIFSLYCLQQTRGFLGFLFFSLMSIILLVLCFINGGRTSLLVLVVSMILNIVFCMKNTNIKKYFFMMLILLVILLLSGVAAQHFLVGGYSANKLKLLFRFLSGSGSKMSSIGKRLFLYKTAIQYFLSSPVFGVGPSGFYSKMLAFSSWYGVPPNPHSFYLQVLANGGSVIFLCFIFFISKIAGHLKFLVKADRVLVLSLLVWNIVGSFQSSGSIESPIFWLAFFIMYFVAMSKRIRSL